MSSPDTPQSEHGLKLGWWVLVAGIGALVVGALLFFTFAALTGHGMPWTYRDPTQNWADVYDLARSATAMAALIGAAIAGAIAIRRQHTTEKSLEISREAQLTNAEAVKISARAQELSAQTLDLNRKAQEREDARIHAEQISRLRDRFTTAASQLGDDSAPIRLAGAYAMAALADEWLSAGEERARAEAQVCIDILCGYIRTKRDYGESDTAQQADTEIRQTIIRIIRDHLQPAAPSSWQGFNLDFTGAVFDGNYSFARAVFSSGTANFAGAVFSGGQVTFNGAEFSGGQVTFNEAKFSDGQVTFNEAKFSDGLVTFILAKFSDGLVTFNEAKFSGGRVTFNEAKFSGWRVTFDGAVFSGGQVTFILAKFSGGQVTFIRAKFSGGQVTFNGTEFSAGRVTFNGTEFSDGRVTFIDTRFAGGRAEGPWDDPENPPEVWPIPPAA